jgi:predicted esterase
MLTKKIIVPKTARYFELGENTQATEHIWIVLHGYAQLANYFIKNFEVLNNEKHLIIAPEGLHRFYWNGFSGRIAASWMTKEDRLDDINDYTNYLNLVYTEVISNLKNKNAKIHLLGFSQGGATVCRWFANKKIRCNSLILWASVIPDDMDFENDSEIFNSVNTYFVVGSKDEFLDEKQIENHKQFLESKKIDFKFIFFEGKHELDKAALIGLSNNL